LHLERSQSSAARLPRPDYTLRPERLKRPEDSESTERDFGARGIARLARASNAQVLSSTVAHAIGTPSQFTVYDADGGVQFHIEQDDLLTSVALSPDGSVAIVAAGDPSHPVVWDAVRGVRLVDCRTPAPLPQSSSGHIGHVAFSANHSEFAFACDDFVAVWSVGEEQPHLVLGDDDGRVPKASGATEAPVVQAIEFHPSEDLLAAGFDDGSVRVWDLNSRRQVVALNALGRLQALAFSPDGKFLATLQSVPLRAVRSVERSNTMTLPTHANRRDEVWLWDFESLVATIDR
jgi:WD40 repeat protein